MAAVVPARRDVLGLHVLTVSLYKIRLFQYGMGEDNGLLVITVSSPFRRFTPRRAVFHEVIPSAAAGRVGQVVEKR